MSGLLKHSTLTYLGTRLEKKLDITGTNFFFKYIYLGRGEVPSKKIRFRSELVIGKLPVVSALQVGVADRLADVRGATEVNHLHAVRLPRRLHQHYVLRLQVGVDKTQLLQTQYSNVLLLSQAKFKII